MKTVSRFFNLTVIILVLIYIYILIAMPQICQNGTFSGILLCGRVIIPSLFPFTMCVLFIMNSGVLRRFDFVFKKLKFFSADIFFIILLSFVGGYPIGAKLLSCAVEEKRICPKRAGDMLNYCVNAGPAFIISAVGNGILHSKELGVVLLCSHIISGLILCTVQNLNKNKKEEIAKRKKMFLNTADNFVKSAADASAAVLSICGFVILFSSINAYINFFGENIKLLKLAGLILEVTNAVAIADNIYLISFILGFGGISVWCQVISIAGKIEINFLKFLVSRVLHGALSVAITFILLRIFPISVSVYSNLKGFTFSYFYSSAAVGISLFVMASVFIISLSSKKYVGKLYEDVL